MGTRNLDLFIHHDVEIKDKNYTIGDRVAIDKGFYCTTKLEIGDYVHIGPYVTCIGGQKTKFVFKRHKQCYGWVLE